ncbi:MAG: 16S rRNA (adenine(1518)-N(6)/adenine(1519)-N(6))-dimethyltransferase RsmA [Bombilactobacillus mellifer]|nr:16S rRNA (adenine(1518)-N(6)/adenine(1519)-N(6))-dimethyltransferase RsmA [Bombilactobacillus mellifer]
MVKFRNKKSLGQNFIKDPQILKKIASVANLDTQTDVLEIGVGSANLTTILAKKAKRVLGFEVDLSLIPLLEKKLKNYHNVYINFNDVLKIDFNQEIKKNLPNSSNLIAVGNIPYYITSPIIHKLLESEINFTKIILMVQKEVAQRIVASPKTNNYSVLSLYIQEFAQPKISFYVNKNNFYPIPKVDSAVITLDLKPNRLPSLQIKEEMKFIELAFSNRRKQLKNNLAHLTKSKEEQNIVSNILMDLFSNTKIRAQELSLLQYRNLISKFKEYKII